MFKEECIRRWEKEMENKYKFTTNSLYWAAKRTLAESDTYSPYATNLLPTQYSIIKSLMDDMTIAITPFTNKMLPKPKHVQINGDYTTVVWKDNTSTVIKRMEGEQNDPEKAVLYAVMKKLFNGNNADMKRYLQEFEDKTVVKEKKNKKQSCECEDCAYYGATDSAFVEHCQGCNSEHDRFVKKYRTRINK